MWTAPPAATSVGAAMNRSALCGAIMAMAAVAALVFVGVAVNELNYASGHPYA